MAQGANNGGMPASLQYWRIHSLVCNAALLRFADARTAMLPAAKSLRHWPKPFPPGVGPPFLDGP